MKNFIVLILIALSFFCVSIIADSLDCFIRGDVNGDGAVNIADSIAAANYVMSGTGVVNDNLDAVDANDDGTLNIADAIYINSMLFSGAPFLIPNFLVGQGLDPTSDNVNTGTSEIDPGDYDAGTLVGEWKGIGIALVSQVNEPGVMTWPYINSDVHGGTTQVETRGASWAVATIPPGTYLWPLKGAFICDQQLTQSLQQSPITVGQVRRACRHGRSSGPGYRISYNYAWTITMEMPLYSGITDVYIDGTAVQVTVVIRTILDATPPIAIKVPLDLGKNGLRCQAIYGSLYRLCPQGYSNPCQTASGSSINIDGDKSGTIVITTEDLYQALAAYPLLPNNTGIYVAGIGMWDESESLQAVHIVNGGDATSLDAVGALLMWSVPSVITTTIDY